MKRFRALYLTVLMLASSSVSLFAAQIVDYAPEHKEAIVEISLQDSDDFFLGHNQIPSWIRFLFGWYINYANKSIMREACEEELKIKKVVLDEGGSVAGFIIYYRTREPSLESIRKNLEKLVPGNELTNEYLVATYPGAKLTDAECDYYALVEAIAVDKSQRGKGYGRILLNGAIEDCPCRWPDTVFSVKLNVNEDNRVARKFYESLGFNQSQDQLLTKMHVVQYERDL